MMAMVIVAVLLLVVVTVLWVAPVRGILRSGPPEAEDLPELDGGP